LRRYVLAASAMVVLAVLVGCASNRALVGEAGGYRPNGVPGPLYKIGPDDVLRVSVEELMPEPTTMTVAPDGTIFVPGIGDVTVAGYTRSQVERHIRAKTGDEKEAVVEIVEYKSKQVYVFGETNVQGPIRYRGYMRVLDVISFAGGVTRSADLGNVTVTRFAPDGNKVIKVNLARVINKPDAEENIEIRPFDYVYVHPDAFATIGYATEKIFSPVRAIFGALTETIRFSTYVEPYVKD